jgi:hypothetical protein
VEGKTGLKMAAVSKSGFCAVDITYLIYQGPHLWRPPIYTHGIVWIYTVEIGAEYLMKNGGRNELQLLMWHGGRNELRPYGNYDIHYSNGDRMYGI